MEYKDESIILRIKEVMKEHGLARQTELAKAVEVQQSTISAMFSLNRSSLPLVEAVSSHWNISKQWLLTGSGMKYMPENNLEPKENGVSLPRLSNEDRVELIRRLNELYARHQKIMSEAQEIMKSIVEIDKKLILNGTDIAGV